MKTKNAIRTSKPRSSSKRRRYVMNASGSSRYATDTPDPASTLVNQNLRAGSMGVPLNVNLIILAN